MRRRSTERVADFDEAKKFLASLGPVDEVIGTPELRLQAMQMTLNYLAGSRQVRPAIEIRHMANLIIRYIEGMETK